MSQDSPSLEYFKNGYREPPDPEKGKKHLWVVIGVLAAVVLVLGGVWAVQSGMLAALAGTGTVTGYAVDETGMPVRVEVLVFNTNIIETSDEEGYFIINDVPAGKQSFIIAAGEIASEVEVRVIGGSETTVGTVTVPSSLSVLLEP